jgi:hypothetical protein
MKGLGSGIKEFKMPLKKSLHLIRKMKLKTKKIKKVPSRFKMRRTLLYIDVNRPKRASAFFTAFS